MDRVVPEFIKINRGKTKINEKFISNNYKNFVNKKFYIYKKFNLAC